MALSKRYEQASGDPPPSTVLTLQLPSDLRDTLSTDIQSNGTPNGLALDIDESGETFVRFFWTAP